MKALAVLVALFAISLAAPAGPQNILFHGLAATLVGTPPSSIQLQPLNIADTRQQWTFDAQGYIVSVFDPEIVIDVESPLLEGGERLVPAARKCIDYLLQRWQVNPDGTIESLQVDGYFVGPDVDSNSQFLEVDYTTPTPAAIQAPIEPYVCTSYNDPHVTKFPCGDNRRLEAHELGRFALAVFGQTRVSTNHTNCYSRPGIACNDLANIRVGTRAIEIRGNVVTINGQAIDFTGTYTVAPDFTVTRIAPGVFRVNVPNGYIETTGSVNAPYFLNFKIVATSGPVPDGGFCACRDGPNVVPAAPKDLATRSLPTTLPTRSTLAAAAFVHSWKYRDFCEDPFFYPNLPVNDYATVNPPTEPADPPVIHTDDPVLQQRAEDLCAPLLGGPLVDACGAVLDPAPFYENCVNDVIFTEDPKWAALVIDAYAAHCSTEGGVQNLPTSASRTIAFGAGLGAEIQQNQVVSFTIQAKDVNGNNRTVGGDTFEITSTGPTALTFTVVDNNDGTYTVTYPAPVAGTYQISVLQRGVDAVLGSPFEVTVLCHGADPSKTVLSGAGIEGPIFAGDQNTFTVQLKLASGQNKQSGGDTITVTVSGSAFVQPVVDNQDGSYTVTYEQVQITTFTITIKVNGVAIGAPIQLESW